MGLRSLVVAFAPLALTAAPAPKVQVVKYGLPY